MRILIMGGTRFIGPPVVRRLHELGQELTVFHRGETEADLPLAVRHIHGDRQQLAEFAGTFRRLTPDLVLDMAAYTEQDARAVVDALHGTARRLVVISSQDVYRAYGRFHGTESGPLEPVPVTEDSPLREQLYPYRDTGRGLDDYEKVLVEQAAIARPDLPATILRLPAVYGEGDYQHRLFLELKRMDDGRPAILLDQRLARWRWTRAYVENAAAAIALAVTDERSAGRVYNVGEADALTYPDWLRRIARAAAWPGRVVIVPDDRLPPNLQPPPGDYAQHLFADTRRIREELDYREVVSRQEGLRRAIEWERAHRKEANAALFDYHTEDAILASLKER